MTSFHLCVTLRQTLPGVAERFIQDVEECTAEIMKNPKDALTGSVSISYYQLHYFHPLKVAWHMCKHSWALFHRTCHQWQLVIRWLLPWQQCFIANQNPECHFTCHWMASSNRWQILWNGAQISMNFLLQKAFDMRRILCIFRIQRVAFNPSTHRVYF